MNRSRQLLFATLIIVGITLGGAILYLSGRGVSYSKYDYPLWSEWDWRVYDHLQVADLNGDQLDDVVISGFESLEVIYQNSTGQFENRTKLLSSGTSGRFIMEDLNGDSFPDICDRNGSGLFTLMNDGAGKFTTSQKLPFSGMRPFSYHSGNSNVPDIGVHKIGQKHRLVMMSNNGSGFFTFNQNITLTSSVNQWDILSHDFNQDGEDEIAIIQSDGNLTVFSLNSSERYDVNVSQYISQIYVAWLISADIDGNGIDDIGLVSTLGPNSGVVVFFSLDSIATGAPIIERSYSTGWLGGNTADLDGDNDLDIILCSYQGTIIAIENERTGTISNEVVFTGFITPHSPAVIDLVGKPSPAIIFLAQSRESHRNLIDVIVIWRNEENILY